MEVACFCGNRFAVRSDVGRCPRCHTIVVLPQTTDLDVEAMRRGLERLTGDPRH